MADFGLLECPVLHCCQYVSGLRVQNKGRLWAVWDREWAKAEVGGGESQQQQCTPKPYSPWVFSKIAYVQRDPLETTELSGKFFKKFFNQLYLPIWLPTLQYAAHTVVLHAVGWWRIGIYPIKRERSRMNFNVFQFLLRKQEGHEG